MDERAKYFPTGKADFKAVREKDSLYVDKTEYIHRLIKSSGQTIYWFLARPRRFGKSLLVDTLNNLFLGRKELFEGLDIHSRGYDFEPFPVINLSMDAVDTDTVENLGSTLKARLREIATAEGVGFSEETPKSLFISLINGLKAKYKKNVVVLIDEYDKPILDYLDNEVMVEKIRKTLQDFYLTLKSQEKNLHFVFITGISKVAQTAIHSSLNNLTDLTLNDDYAAICGYTIEEFHAAFDPYLEATLASMRAKGRVLANHTPEGLTQAIFKKYDGYSWDGRTKILNPFSINSFFSSQKFDKFWFVTGPPTYLDKAMKIDPYAFAKLSLTEYGLSKLLTASLGSANPVPTLFQTGYLTVDQVINYDPTSTSKPASVSNYAVPLSRVKDETFYTLKVPNEEVKLSYENALFNVLYHSLSSLGDDKITEKSFLIQKSLLNKDIITLENEFKSILSSLPYNIHIQDHRFYQALLYYYLQGLISEVRSEVMSAEGRSDLEITLFDDTKVIIELKYIPAPNAALKDGSNKEESDKSDFVKTDQVKVDADWINKKLDQTVLVALTQIEEKNYARQYLGQYKVLKVGLAIYHRADIKIAFGPDQEKNG
ncbi:MAG: ATP-binding protein [Deltaproteobacteria bacterium]|jgi:hypothetical protein|nr:ATP-binding protein [Deltaproteobacteria bacterium]